MIGVSCYQGNARGFAADMPLVLFTGEIGLALGVKRFHPFAKVL
jgi:hypothetical protein